MNSTEDVYITNTILVLSVQPVVPLVHAVDNYDTLPLYMLNKKERARCGAAPRAAATAGCRRKAKAKAKAKEQTGKFFLFS